MASLFFSYSHKDEDLRDQLEVHLSMIKREGLIETWHDRRIPAGEEFDRSIDDNLEEADVILLLVSADFLASRYCFDREVKRAMERHENGSARVIPVILRPCDWQSAPFGALLAAPKDGKPITRWTNRDEAFVDVTRQIRMALRAKTSDVHEISRVQSAASAVPPRAPLRPNKKRRERPKNQIREAVEKNRDRKPDKAVVVAAAVLIALGIFASVIYWTSSDRFASVRSLRTTGPETNEQDLRLVTSLLPFLTNEDEKIRRQALETLNRLSTPRLKDVLPLLKNTEATRAALISVASAPQSNTEHKEVAREAFASMTKDSVGWFLEHFGSDSEEAIRGTTFKTSLVAAIAFQETGYLWAPLAKKSLKPKRVLSLCVGDTISEPYRSAWPKSKADLISVPNGEALFRVAREALLDVAAYEPAYKRVVENPDKFCHLFGIFGYDIQWAKSDPTFFLDRKWDNFDECGRRLVAELRSAAERAGLAGKPVLDETDLVMVAIAYNRGSVDLTKGDRQGFRDTEGKYYGESIRELIRIAEASRVR